METYIADAAAAASLLLSKGKRVCIVLVGLPGSGKSTQVKALVKALLPAPASVHSLDAIRTELNGGSYPSSNDVMRRLLPAVVAAYSERVMADASPVIIMDNTHWRWTPDWDAVKAKVAAESRWVITLTPPHSEYSLLTNRSTHGVPASKYRDMLHSAPGLAFAQLLHCATSPADVLALKVPNPPWYSPTIVPWPALHPHEPEQSDVYIGYNYLGWTSPTIVRAYLTAAALLPADAAPYVGRRSGAVHITLAFAKHKNVTHAVLLAVAKQLARTHAPRLALSGVGSATEAAGNTTWFVTLTDASHAELEALVQQAIDASGHGDLLHPNKDGFHITLGYTTVDVHGVAKRIANVIPVWPTTWDARAQAPEVAPVFTPLLPAAVDAALAPVATAIRPQGGAPEDWDIDAAKTTVAAYLRAHLHGPVSTVTGADELVRLLAWAAAHTNLKLTLRDCTKACPVSLMAAQGTPYLVNIAVTTGARRGPDDDVYATFPAIQAHVPRGLTLAFMWHKDAVQLEPVTIHPTPKFGGDNDNEDTGDVTVMDDAELRKEAAGATRYVVTEKANGEMFTATVVKTYANGSHWVVAGSKQNKFALWMLPSGALLLPSGMVTTNADAWLRNTWAGTSLPTLCTPERDEWDRKQLWGEMLATFISTLQPNSKSKPDSCAPKSPLLQYLASEGLTACAEFESYLHPHLEAFPHGHRAIRYFALTKRASGTTHHAVFKASERLLHLHTLRDVISVDTVTWETTPTLDLVALRRRVWCQDGKEGVVVLALAADDTILRMIKLKSIWYVVNRGLRERFRSWKPKQHWVELTLEDTEAAAAKKLQEKLAIFAAYPAAKEVLDEKRAWYKAYAKAFARVVHLHCGEPTWRQRFDVAFPDVMAEARAWLEQV